MKAKEPLTYFLDKCAILFYRLIVQLVYWIYGGPQKFSASTDSPQDAITVSASEENADSLNENDIMRISTSTPEGDALFIECCVHNSHTECRVILLKDGIQYMSRRLISKTSDDKTYIHCGPLLLEMREAFRRLRVRYVGEMIDQYDVPHKISIRGWLKPTHDARSFFTNGHQIIADNCAKRPLDIFENVKLIRRLFRRRDFIQFGELHCEVAINGADAQRIRFRGIREKRETDEMERTDSMTVYTEDGTRFYWRSEDLNNHQINLRNGILTKSSHSVTSLHCNGNDALLFDPEKLGIIRFSDDRNERISLAKHKHTNSAAYTSTTGLDTTVQFVSTDYIGHQGTAIFIQTKTTFAKPEAIRFTSAPGYTADANVTSPVLAFHHRECMDPELSGGKGSNLAKLTTMSHNYAVPRGFVITTSAYQAHVDNNKHVKEAIAAFKKGKSIDNCLKLGEGVETALLSSKIDPALLEEIQETLKFECGDDALLAVRSSAVGEDGADLSSAGQLESFLNVQSGEIEQKVLQCWASNFRREVISYRRNYGQRIDPPMAVVVQAMVAGTAGVMFTCDPVSADHSTVIINALIGMGEEIVSGNTTPDTIKMNKSGGIVGKPDHCCLSNSLLSRLLDVGIFLEETFSSPQDIEFIVDGERVYLLQTRNITGLDRESEFELTTEFDSGMLTNREILTTANVGEVMPRPMTPLTLSSTFVLYQKAIDCIFLSFAAIKNLPLHYSRSMNNTRQKVFFNIGELFLPQWQVLEHDPLTEYTLGGDKLLTPEMYELGKERHPPLSPVFPIFRLGYMIKGMFWDSKKAIAKAHILAKELKSLESTNAQNEELLSNCEEQRRLLVQLIHQHGLITSCSSFTYIIVAMVIRGSDRGDLTEDMLSDIGKLFGNSSAAVLSADVPASLQKIARAIAQSSIKDEFSALSGDLAVELLHASSDTSKLIQDFFTKHGHRGPFELDLRTKGWTEDTELLVTTLKTMMSNPKLLDVIEESQSVDVVNQLKHKKTGIARKLLEYMVKQTHHFVAMREEATDLLVRGTVSLRANLKTLAQKLQETGLIPDIDLLFFFTIDEVSVLIKTRSPKLIARALRRRQFFPKQCNLQYKHVYWGCVEPLAPVDDNALKAVAQLRGTAVCEGKVLARARVARTLEEARETQPGEILITRFTDICWSPFFPIVGGVVTEIGGLLSHGAVVAREYGVPCLIAVTHATDVFRTGELVELNAYKGTISKMVS